MPQINFSGNDGLLKSGSRVVTALKGWRAGPVDGRLRVTATAHEPDPYWWEHHDGAALELSLTFGKSGLRGPAEIVSSDPLVIALDAQTEGA